MFVAWILWADTEVNKTEKKSGRGKKKEKGKDREVA